MSYVIRPIVNGALATAAVISTVTNNFTMSIWAKLTTNTTQNALFYNGNSGANGWGIIADASTGFQILFGGVALGPNVTTPRAGVWHNVVFVRDAGTSVLIVDGHLRSSTSATAPGAPTTRTAAVTSATGSIWRLCEAAIWEVPLNLNAIERLAQGVPANMVGPTPKAYFPLHQDTIDIIGGKRLDQITGVQTIDADTPGIIVPRLWIPERAYATTISPPINTVAPVASGTPEVGQTLSCTTGTWSPTGDSYSYQWQYYDGTWNNIGGATSSTWVVDISGAVDVTDSIKCVVTATNGGGSVAADSNTLGPVTDVTFTGHASAASIG